MAGKKETRHERLLGVSRLDGRKRGGEGRGGSEGWLCDTERRIKNKERGKERWVDEINRDRGENEA